MATKKDTLNIFLKALSEFGVDINGRPRPDVAAGVCSGLIDGRIFFAEAIGTEEGVTILLRDPSLLPKKRFQKLSQLFAAANENPKFFEDGRRWARVIVRERTGWFDFIVVANIRFNFQDADAAEICKTKTAFFIETFKSAWNSINS